MTVFSKIARKAAACCLLGFALPVFVQAQSGFISQGIEYPVAGTLKSDQTYPDLALKVTGGYVVWQDNITDGSGLGISAQRLDGSFSAVLSSFRVNVQGTNDQSRPRVALLNGGGAVFVWQSGRQGFQHIQARFLSSSNTWLTGDIMVNAITNFYQTMPSVATLAGGDVVVTWSSFNQEGAGSMQGVYGQRFSSTGAKLGGEFLVNQTATYNQRTPTIAPLSDGRFVIAWVSEQQRYENSVDIYARFFTAAGGAASGEFLVSGGASNICANPSLAAATDGGFLAAWSMKNAADLSNSWDVVAVPVSGGGFMGIQRRLNTQTYGDQIGPRVSSAGSDYMAVWTSLAQDGSAEGVYGQILHADGSLSGGEIRVNSVTLSQQIHPVVASDKIGRFLTTWTSFGGLATSFDLKSQQFVSTNAPLPAMDPPFVTVLSSSALTISWPTMAGYSVANYEIYADGATTATATVTNSLNAWTATGLAAGSSHSYRLAFVLTDERRSPASVATTNSTYGPFTYFGIPADWMAYYFGDNWPQATADSDGDGVSNKNEFLAGTNPNDPNSVLRTRLDVTPQGLFLNWNTQPGLIYQVQTSPNMVTWSNLGGMRFASGALDSMYVGGASAGFYRLVRVR